MNNIYKYSKEKYKFSEHVSKLFNCELNKLHTIREKDYELFTQIGKDSNTEFHQKFYKNYKDGWEVLVNMYNDFIADVIFPLVKEITGETEFAYQTFPSFRVQLPNNVAVVKYHYDSDEEHGHPDGEINFVIPLTKMYDTNSIWVESEPNKKDFNPLEMNVGEFVCWNFNKCYHGNKINTTKDTRVSFDFRILPLSKYTRCNTNRNSASTNTKFTIGNYYRYLSQSSITNIKNNNDLSSNQLDSENTNKNDNNSENNQIKDIWDKEKKKFNSTMIKYGVNDAWGVVDIFEKRIAEYAGSKYAVSVDCCTNALFLCLKYLKGTGKITIPSRTWISVPCSIKHAGCEVEFEDVEWSGMYQLKPYPIWDGAVRMKKGMYQPGTYHCLSFHIRKHIPIGRGGMILTDNKEAYDWFRTVRYCGRTMSDDSVNYLLYKDDPISDIGWNMYMTPEQAARGLELFEKINEDNIDQESSGTCKDLSKLPFYNENYYYTYDYWFNKEIHQCWHNGDENYYVNYFYEEIIFKLDIPKEGKIVVLGTHNCVAFDKLCNFFGKDRVIGYDLYNPNNHPNVVIKDCNTLDEKIDIAFLHNDLGSFSTTPKLKLHGYNWAIKNMIKGGYILGNNNLNRAKIDIEGIFNNNNFSNQYLKDLDSTKFNLQKLSKKEIHNGREFCALDGYMISKKL